MDGRNEWGEETTAEREIKRASGAAGGSSTLLLSLLSGRQEEEGDGGMKEGVRKGWKHHASPSACYPPLSLPFFSPTSSTTVTTSVRCLPSPLDDSPPI